MSVSAADRAEILDVIGRADAAATSRDARAYAGLFTDDAVLDGTQGAHAGSAALLASVGPIWATEGPASLHLTLNPVVDPGDGPPPPSPRQCGARAEPGGSAAAPVAPASQPS
jgi:ketosteroid isomerase-like protein